MDAPTPAPGYPTPQPLSPADERTWAMLAHLSALLNLVTGFLGPVAALVIYLVYRERSRYVAYQSLQSFLFQVIAWVGGGAVVGVAWAVSGVLAAVLIGFLCMPVALILSVALLAVPIYAIVGAVQCNSGQDFRYWLVGDWVRNTLTGA